MLQLKMKQQQQHIYYCIFKMLHRHFINLDSSVAVSSHKTRQTNEEEEETAKQQKNIKMMKNWKRTTLKSYFQDEKCEKNLENEEKK